MSKHCPVLWINATTVFSGRRTGHLDGNITTAILLERPLYLANSIVCPDQKEAEDIGHLKFMLSR